MGRKKREGEGEGEEFSVSIISRYTLLLLTFVNIFLNIL